MRDMFLSLGLVAIVIAVVWFFSTPRASDVNPAFDPAPVVAGAQQAGVFPVATATTLDQGWTINNARYTPSKRNFSQGTWHIGYINGDQYVGIDQSNTNDQNWLKQVTNGAAEPDEPVIVTAGGRTWEVRSISNLTSLINEKDDVTTIVSGTLSQEQLVQIAAGLEYK